MYRYPDYFVKPHYRPPTLALTDPPWLIATNNSYTLAAPRSRRAGEEWKGGVDACVAPVPHLLI